MAVLWSSYFGMPVSTSHCLVGAVVGIGLAQKLTNTGSVNVGVLVKIFVAWVVTIPVSMALALAVFLPFRGFF
jgi:PiT family inorganic phosphate transporter